MGAKANNQGSHQNQAPDYTDTQPLPAEQSALWKYKAIYRQGDDRAGQWSDVVSIPVAG